MLVRVTLVALLAVAFAGLCCALIAHSPADPDDDVDQYLRNNPELDQRTLAFPQFRQNDDE